MQVVRRDHSQLVDQLARQVKVPCDLVAVRVEQLRQHVASVDPHGPHPREMVETDLIHLDSFRFDAEHAGEGALKADRDVAQPDGPMAVVEQ